MNKFKDQPLISEPVFLVGAERSGTTLLRLMLSHHPKLAWCNEFEYAVDRMPTQGGFPELQSYYDWLGTHRVFRATGFTIDPTLTYPELVNSFLCQRRDFYKKQMVGATVHRHFERVLRVWPDARFIHLIRDGRDVANSCINMGWAGNVWTGVERWIEAELAWKELSQKLPPERQIEITYEALISQPVETLTRLCNFIGIPYDSAMLDYAKNTNFDLPDPKYIAQWQRKLSAYEIQLLESRIGKMLKERGYPISDFSPLTLTPQQEKQLKLEDWLKRAQFRLKRYGVGLFLENYLATRSGIKPWQKRVKLKVNEIDTKYLK